MRAITKGSTDQSVVIRIVDSGDGTPETGVTSATSGLDLKYRREGAATANLTESDLSALTDAHSDGGMLHIGAGYYRVDVPDAAFASGANGVLIFGTVTGMVVIGCYVHLTDYNPQDGVRLGLTALPNAAAGANSGLLTCTSANVLPTDAIVAASLATGAITAAKFAAGAIDAAAIADNAIDAGALAADCITAAKIADNAIDAGALAADCITAAKIATGAIDADAVADGAIDAGALADGAITAAKLATGAITAAKFAAGAIDAAAIAANAIDADALAADAVSEIQSGLATASNVSAVEADTQDIQSRLPAALVSGRMLSDAAAVSGSTAAADAVEANIGNLDGTVSSRASQASVDTVDDFLDTEIAAIKAKTDNLPAAPAAVGSAMTLAADAIGAAQLAADAGTELAAALLDLASGVETNITVRQALRLVLAASAGKLSGAATTTIVIRNVGDTVDRITATVDADGNRSAVTVNAA